MRPFFAAVSSVCARLAEILAATRAYLDHCTGSFVLPSFPACIRGALVLVTSWGRTQGPVELKVGHG